MGKVTISEKLKSELKKFLKKTRSPELVGTYLFFVEKKFKLKPVLFPRAKTIYQSIDQLIEALEKEGKLWRETEIKIRFDDQNVNENTQKIYICPFSGKVFGDNTCNDPLDAIYEWVSACPENKERVEGLRVKRFYVSEDPKVIKNYISKIQVKEVITKVVYSSVVSGKLFNNKKAVIDDFKANYVKPLTLGEVQNQNRFQIEDHFLAFLQEHLEEEKVTAFVQVLAEYPEFMPYVEKWLA